jgi:hypothetical protein
VHNQLGYNPAMRVRSREALGLIALGILILLFLVARSWHLIDWGWR